MTTQFTYSSFCLCMFILPQLAHTAVHFCSSWAFISLISVALNYMVHTELLVSGWHFNTCWISTTWGVHGYFFCMTVWIHCLFGLHSLLCRHTDRIYPKESWTSAVFPSAVEPTSGERTPSSGGGYVETEDVSLLGVPMYSKSANILPRGSTRYH